MATGKPSTSRKKRITHDEAAAVMLAHGLEPLTTYTRGNDPWPCRCLTCGAEVTPRYSQVANGSSKGCVPCGRAARSEKLKEGNRSVAANAMRAAGFEPLVPYPGINTPWSCRCLRCHRNVTPRYGAVRSGGDGCGHCSGRLVDPDEAVELMRKAGLEPLVAYPGSGIPWKCLCLGCSGIVSPRYSSINAGRSSGCRPCRTATRAEVKMREFAFEPLVPYPGPNVEWLCVCTLCGREDTPRYPTVLRKSALGCGICRESRVDPEKAAQVMRDAGLEPLLPYPGAGGWACRCMTCGGEVAPSYGSVRAGGGCRYCSGSAVEPDEAAAYMRSHGLELLVAYPGSRDGWRSCCTQCGEVVEPIYSMLKAGRVKPCRHCSQRQRATSMTLSADVAEGIMLSAGLRPLEPYTRGDKAWRCECLTCGRVESPSLQTVQGRRKTGCSLCRRIGGDVEHVIAMMQEHGFTPLEPFVSMSEPWLCRCAVCGTEHPVRAGNIKNGVKCRVCTGLFVSPETADARMRELAFTPLEPYPGNARARWRCICELCGRVTEPTYKSARKGLRSGCCTGKYDLRIPGRSMGVYLITHDGFGAAKVGIAVVEADGRIPRVASHLRNGWTLHKSWTGIASLGMAFTVERAVLGSWRTAGFPIFLQKSQMPQSGYTETVELALIQLPEVMSVVDSVIDGLTTSDSLVAS